MRFLTFNFVLQITKSYLQILVLSFFSLCIASRCCQFSNLFWMMKFSERDITLQVNSPEMDKKQRHLSRVQYCAKPVFVTLHIFFTFCFLLWFIFESSELLILLHFSYHHLHNLFSLFSNTWNNFLVQFSMFHHYTLCLISADNSSHH